MMGMFGREAATLHFSIGYHQDHLTASFNLNQLELFTKKKLTLFLKEKLKELLEELNSWKRADFIEKGGWDMMPGQEKAGYLVSRACADGLELLFEK
jgi:hypothetical protein